MRRFRLWRLAFLAPVVCLIGAACSASHLAAPASSRPSASPSPSPRPSASTSPSPCAGEETRLDAFDRRWNNLGGPAWGTTAAQHVRADFWAADHVAIIRSDLESQPPVSPQVQELYHSLDTGLGDMQTGYRDLAESWQPSGSYQTGVHGNALWREGRALLSHANTLAHHELCAASGPSVPPLPVGTGSTDATLVRRSPPGGGYSVLLPVNWRFRNATYPSDHSTHAWYDPSDPLRKLVIILSACVGCVSNPSQTAPDPAELLADDPSVERHSYISAWETAFQAFSSQDSLPDNGIVIVLHAGSQIGGYNRLDLYLASSEHALATRILNSYSPGG